MSRILTAVTLCLLVAAVLLFAISKPTVRASSASEQVIFSDSGTGFGNFVNPATKATSPTPFGFWIWCEGDSANPYQGECSGAIYFYAFGITKGVKGTVSETSSNTYMMSVASSDGVVSCALTNVPPITRSLTNKVNMTCSSPAGSGADSKAVVNVTGP
jgi:hypothetical protein